MKGVLECEHLNDGRKAGKIAKGLERGPQPAGKSSKRESTPANAKPSLSNMWNERRA